MLDFGVVRAHSRHTLKVVLSNPTQLPMMLQLRQFKAESFSQDFDCLIAGSVLGIVKGMQRLSRCGKGGHCLGSASSMVVTNLVGLVIVLLARVPGESRKSK